MNIFREKIVELFANSGDPDQTPRSAASDLGLRCLPVTRLGVSSPQWVKNEKNSTSPYNVYPRITMFSLYYRGPDGVGSSKHRVRRKRKRDKKQKS